jgi:hypothetical protein
MRTDRVAAGLAKLLIALEDDWCSQYGAWPVRLAETRRRIPNGRRGAAHRA